MSSTKPRAVCFGFGIPRGGVPAFAHQLAQAVTKLAVRPVMLFSPGAGYEPNERKWGLNEWKFALCSFLRLGLKRFFKRELIHLHSRSLLVPDVYTVHGLYTCDWMRNPRTSLAARMQFRLLSGVEKRLIRKSRRVAFVSKQNKEFAEGLLGLKRPDAFAVINPGVDCERFSISLRAQLQANRRKFFPEIDPATRWVLFVGSDFERKGLPVLLDAFKKVTDSSRSWRFLVFGKDLAAKSKVRSLAAPLGAQVVFFEDDPRLDAAYGLSDVLVMASVSEGYPLVLLEAMAAGCIPFVTKFEGTSEAIVESRNGFRFDDAEGLVRRALTESNENLIKMQTHAREFALERTWAHTAKAYERLYESLDAEDLP